MHSFSDCFQSFADDIDRFCNEIEDSLFSCYSSQPNTHSCRTDPQHTNDRPAPTASDYNRAIQNSPTDGKLFYNRGIERYRYGDNLLAIADYNQAISLDPDFSLAYAARAFSNLQLDRAAEALTDADRAIELNPDFAWAYDVRARIRSFSGDTEGSIADFTRHTQLQPSTIAYYNLGVTQLTANLYGSALANLSKAIDLQPESSTYYARSVALAGLGDDLGADRDYSTAIALDTPGSGSLSTCEHAFYFRALAKARKDRRDEAKADLQTAINICDRLHNRPLKELATAKLNELDRAV